MCAGDVCCQIWEGASLQPGRRTRLGGGLVSINHPVGPRHHLDGSLGWFVWWLFCINSSSPRSLVADPKGRSVGLHSVPVSFMLHLGFHDHSALRVGFVAHVRSVRPGRPTPPFPLPTTCLTVRLGAVFPETSWTASSTVHRGLYSFDRHVIEHDCTAGQWRALGDPTRWHPSTTS